MTQAMALEIDREAWMEDAVATIIGLSLNQEFVTADDLRREVGDAPSRFWPGLAFSKARNRGFIESVDSASAKAKSRKNGALKVWTRTQGDPDRARFWAKVEKTESCWLWTAATYLGYGKFRYHGESNLAHRVAYEWLVGPIPEGMMLDHICHNPRCVNPEHMRPVTSKQNQENRLSANGNKFRGVSRTRYGRWQATVKHNRKAHYAGNFGTREEAAEAARQLRLSLFTHNDPDRSTK